MSKEAFVFRTPTIRDKLILELQDHGVSITVLEQGEITVAATVFLTYPVVRSLIIALKAGLEQSAKVPRKRGE